MQKLLVPPEEDRLLQFLATEGFPRNKIGLIIVFGSKLWGTATARSDTDVIVIHTLPKPAISTRSGRGFDLQLMSEQEFLSRCSVWEPQCASCLWFPNIAINFYEKNEKFMTDIRKSLPYDLKVIMAACNEMWSSDTEKATKFFSHGDKEKAKKKLTHSVRYISIIAGVTQHHGAVGSSEFDQCVSDANDVLRELQNMYCDEFEPVYACVESVVSQKLDIIART
eukprot:PhF_6_TR35736/c0_g1_i1/m.51894